MPDPRIFNDILLCQTCSVAQGKLTLKKFIIKRECRATLRQVLRQDDEYTRLREIVPAKIVATVSRFFFLSFADSSRLPFFCVPRVLGFFLAKGSGSTSLQL